VTAPHVVLGISAFYHDSAACLVRDGVIVAAAQEERFSRLKHDSRFPAHAIAYCLEAGGISASQLSCIAFYEKPWIKFERLVETYLAYAPRGLRSFLMSMPVWLKRKLWIERWIREQLDAPHVPFIFTEHHGSHAASAFFPSPFPRAAIITADGVGEWATATWGVGEGPRISIRQEQQFPHSLGLLYSAFTYYCGFRVNSGEYKLMGLAPYGEPRFVRLILDEMVDLRPDGSFRLNMEYFAYPHGLRMTSPAFHRLFRQGPRAPEGELTSHYADVAHSIQAVTEDVMLRTAAYVRTETGEKDLCMAGGIALNAVANGRILRQGLFDRVWVQPAAGDAGGALGAALFAHHQVHGGGRTVDGVTDAQQGSFLGPSYAPAAVRDELARWGIPHHRLDDDGELLGRVASLLADGRVVGWFSGRAEFGPRALGARSILADARRPEMQSLLNQKIKFRESFRPFAPACLREDVEEYFEISVDAPYMLFVAPLREARRKTVEIPAHASVAEQLREVRSDIPAVTHVDHSARLQTVDAARNPRFHRLLCAFKELTGCSVLVNTSFNRRDEPIVNTPMDAYACFMGTRMDALVLEDCLLLKEDQPNAMQEEPTW
jgi:carbamoyltransferase